MGSLVGNLGAAEAYKAEAAVHQANARVARAQGQAARGQAYGQAARVEAENEVAGQQAVMNMERLREQETQAQGAVQAARGASGFTAQGSGSRAEISLLQAYEQQAQDMAYSRALQDQSARFSASMARKSGDLAEMGADVNANYEASQAAISKIKKRNSYTAAAFDAVASIVGGAVGGGTGAMIGSSVAQAINGSLTGSVESMGGGSQAMQAMGYGNMARFITNNDGARTRTARAFSSFGSTMGGWLA
mgnify:CR=1 FL=1